MYYNSKRICAVLAASVMMMSAFSGCSKNNTVGPESVSGAAESESETALSAVNTDFTSGQVAIGGGGFVTGIINTNEAGLFYARTDVGGAYRWDKDENRWICLSADISAEDVGLLGIDGIAVDPNNAARVFMAAGTEYFSGAKTCILISEDYGNTFRQVDVSDMIKVHGNGMGRGNGERVAVDPNNGDIIYVGGRTGGLIRSSDGGNTWEAVASFPVTSTKNGNGINVLMFDGSKSADGKTLRIYAGVSEASESNIYYSDDAGETWQVLPCLTESSKKLMPERMDLDSKGRLYVSYGNHEGPWNSSKGKLIRYDLSDNSAKEFEDIVYTIGDIVIDPNDDNRIFLVTSEVWDEQPNGAFGDRFFRTTDGGETWEPLDGKYTLTTNGMDWISNAAIHWCSVLAMDSGDSGKVLVNSGNGIFACDDVWADSPEFYFDAKGIEETVPLDIISYKDYPLVSAIGDYDGFIHEDIMVSAERHSKQIGSCTSITIAAQDHDIWAKVGGSESAQLLSYSTDGGKTWEDITTSPDEKKTLYGGRIALTADGSALLWSSSNALYTYRTEDWGKTWEKVEGIIGSSEVYLIGDPENKDYVYGCANGVFYASSDGGKKFSRKYDMSSSWRRLAIAPGQEGTVYIPGGGSGLIMTRDHGDSVELVPGLKYCEAVGLGKPKNDGDPYVIYVWGIPKDSETAGIYMSEDEGATWVRMNDDFHEYGGIGNGQFVSGDMNVYGRCYMSTVGMGIAYFDKNEK
ncbi:MAG: YCF48-related protein [Huintestinicola sp.]